MNKIISWIEKIAKIYNMFIGIPVIAMFFLVLAYNEFDNPIVKKILYWALPLFIIAYVFVIVSLIITKSLSKEFILWPLIFIVSIFVLSFISKPNKTIEIIQIILIEAYIVYYLMVCIVKGKANVSLMFALSILFIVLGLYSIYYYTYNTDTANNKNDLFNALITVFSAIVGGAITLGGVGWGIRQNDKDRKDNLILQAKPIFYSISLNATQRRSNKPLSLAYLDNSKHGCYVLKSIANTDHSIFFIKKIVVDKKEYLPLNNNLVDKGKVYDILINTEKIDENSILYLYTEDSLNNEYVFKMTLFKAVDCNKEYEKYNVLNVVEVSENEKNR